MGFERKKNTYKHSGPYNAVRRREVISKNGR